MEVKKTFFVYIDYATRGPNAGRPYYVGMGGQSRVDNKARSNLHFELAVEHGWRREVVLGTYDRDYALMIETRLIAEKKTMHSLSGWGANMTPGEGFIPDRNLKSGPEETVYRCGWCGAEARHTTRPFKTLNSRRCESCWGQPRRSARS